MPEPKAAPESNPRHPVARLKQLLHAVATYVRQDSGKSSNPGAKALFETTAQALFGLSNAFVKKNEAAWR